jgi:hypothetical protein
MKEDLSLHVQWHLSAGDFLPKLTLDLDMLTMTFDCFVVCGLYNDV